jgi:hypothetical protein
MRKLFENGVEQSLPAVLESLGRTVLGSLEMGVIPDHRVLELLALAALVQTGAGEPVDLERAFERYGDVTGCAVEERRPSESARTTIAFTTGS